jgi:hypothetical protein
VRVFNRLYTVFPSGKYAPLKYGTKYILALYDFDTVNVHDNLVSWTGIVDLLFTVHFDLK